MHEPAHGQVSMAENVSSYVRATMSQYPHHVFRSRVCCRLIGGARIGLIASRERYSGIRGRGRKLLPIASRRMGKSLQSRRARTVLSSERPPVWQDEWSYASMQLGAIRRDDAMKDDTIA